MESSLVFFVAWSFQRETWEMSCIIELDIPFSFLKLPRDKHTRAEEQKTLQLARKCKCLAIFSPAYHTTTSCALCYRIKRFFSAPSVMWSKVKTFHLGFHLRKYRGWKHYLRYFHNSFATLAATGLLREKLEKWPNFVVAAVVVLEDLAQLNTHWVCLQLSTS